MAVKSTAKEIAVFKANLELLMPYQDHAVLNELAKGLYTSSNFQYEIVKGLNYSVAINKIQMYSRHNVEAECRQLCAHLPIAKLYHIKNFQHAIDDIEFKLLPNRKLKRQQERTHIQEESKLNDEALSTTLEPAHLDTSDFPEISQGLIITNASDNAFAPEREDPLKVTIYGMAAGHVVEYLTKLYPKLEINVVILNPEVSAIMLSLDPQMGKRLAKENVHLYLGNDDTPILDNRIILLPELNVAPHSNSRLKQRLTFFMERDYSLLLMRKKQHDLMNLVLQYNYPHSLKAQQLTMHDLSITSEIALIMPGPSLKASVPRLKELKYQGVTLIACDSALPFLESHHIYPDMVVVSGLSIYQTVGKNNILPAQCLSHPQIYQNTTLIYTPKTHLLFLSVFPGKKRLVYTSDMRRMKIPVQEGAITDLDVTLSVSSLMASLAVKMQAQRVYLFGMDTVSYQDSYYTGFSAEALPFMQSTIVKTDMVICNDGNERPALHQFTNFRLHFEEIIEHNPHIEFINCASTGAIIKGCTLDLASNMHVEYENFNALF